MSAKNYSMFCEVIRKRFWRKVEVRSNTDCWIWKGGFNQDGYGQFCGRVLGKPFNVGAHRYVYFICVGIPPSGSLVCHKCDVRRCVNPTHLFAGTPNDNTQDMIRKGRSKTCGNRKVGSQRPKGEKRKLSEADVIDIRRQHSQGLSLAQIAAKYSMDASSIYDVVSRISWNHVK